jgi:DNA-binding transcriptional ArsR family regulator
LIGKKPLDNIFTTDIIIFTKLNMIRKEKIELSKYDIQAQIFKVFSHPARIAILNILRDGEHCVCHLEAHLGFRQAYISQQLNVLREAGLILDRRNGWNIYYRVADERIFDVLNAVQQFSGVGEPEVKENEVNCTCPTCSSKANIITQ